jgi:hypothetical protein
MAALRIMALARLPMSSEVLGRECSPGAAFQVSFERECTVLVRKCYVGAERPGAMLCGVRYVTRVVRLQPRFCVIGYADVEVLSLDALKDLD